MNVRLLLYIGLILHASACAPPERLAVQNSRAEELEKPVVAVEPDRDSLQTNGDRNLDEEQWVSAATARLVLPAAARFVPESEIASIPDEGLGYVFAMIRWRSEADPERGWRALSQLSTRDEGSVRWLPELRGFLIADYSLVLQIMHRLIRCIDRWPQQPRTPAAWMFVHRPFRGEIRPIDESELQR